jgi:hypothetical protein
MKRLFAAAPVTRSPVPSQADALPFSDVETFSRMFPDPVTTMPPAAALRTLMPRKTV